MTRWQGIFPAVITPFHEDESLDVPTLQTHLERLLAAGMDGLIVLGTVGENTALTLDEKLQVLQVAVETVNHRVPVLTGVAECSTRQAVQFTERAQALGVDGLMVLPAIGYRADRREALAHFRTILKRVTVPVMLYNNPVVYHVDIRPEDFAELTDYPQLVAIKESSDDVRRITDLRRLYGQRFALFCGVDDLVLESVLLGADGWVAGLVNAYPRETRRLWEVARAGRWSEALALYRWFTPLLHLDTRTKLVQCIKLACREQGIAGETARAPRDRLEGAEREEVLQIIREAATYSPLAERN
ncbi:MAG: dihydrodipicolinate synthase family protein [Planctomycetaceae bacterium]|nr:MAG: dihydrodipicolinate synthase family protein [Planctomycetaceae bacterium]